MSQLAQEIGKWLYFGGIALFILGAVISYFPRSISWFGKLPGDFRIQGERISVFIPLTSMLLTSLVVSVAAHLVSKYLTRS